MDSHGEVIGAKRQERLAAKVTCKVFVHGHKQGSQTGHCLQGNINLINAAREKGVKKFVLVTSIGTGNSRDAPPSQVHRSSTLPFRHSIFICCVAFTPGPAFASTCIKPWLSPGGCMPSALACLRVLEESAERCMRRALFFWCHHCKGL